MMISRMARMPQATKGQNSPQAKTPKLSRKYSPHPPAELKVPVCNGVLNHPGPIQECTS